MASLLRVAVVSAAWLAFGGLGCRKATTSVSPEGEREGSPASASAAVKTPTVAVLVAYGSEKKTWIEEQIAAFNQSHTRLASGAVIAVTGKALGSGEAMQDILGERLKPVVFSPASGAYLTLINEAWAAQHPQPLAPSSESIVISPIVIAIWKPMAEALGWPKKALGWADILKLGHDPRGWEGLGRPEWGQFKLGHTHPEYSNSGLLAVLAEAYAGAGKTRDLKEADLALPKTRSLLEGIEKSIVHYGKSTGFFSEKMLSRGPSYLSAAVLYENLVIESYAHAAASGLNLVSIYPREGTFWSDHPYAILDAPWVSPEQKQGAERLLAFLKTRPAQERALALGLRPADPALGVGSPVDAEHGCDPKQPQTLLEVPKAAVLARLLDTFRELKKPSDVSLVFDKSGSMRGAPLEQAKAGAKSFLNALSPRDEAALLFFDDRVYPPLGPLKIADGRSQLLERVSGVSASGGTALYEAVVAAYQSAQQRALANPNSIHALVVMTDGKDENSAISLAQLKQQFPHEGQEAEVKVFTIAYGTQASATVLSEIAEAGDGSNSQGTVENIVQVYRDVASFF